MSAYKNDSITWMQFVFLIHGAQITIVVFSLPRLVAESAGTDGWISIALNWLIAGLSGWLLLLTLQKYPTLTLPELLERLFGKWLGKLLLLLPVCYFSLVGWFILVNMSLLINSWFLPKTANYVFMFLLAVPCYMIVRKGPRVHGRFCELIFYITVWTLLMLFLPLKHGHWLHLLPVLKNGWMPIVSGAFRTMHAFSGILIVWVYYPYLQKKQYAVHGLHVANTITFIIYFFIAIVCFVYFSPDGITSLNQPVLTLMKNIEFRFLERMDTVELAVYLLIVFTSLTPFIYSALFTISRLLGKSDHQGVATGFFIVAIVVAHIAKPTWTRVNRWAEMINAADLALLLAVPIALFFYVWGLNKVRKRRTR